MSMISKLELSEDAHSRVAILFEVPGTIAHKATLVAISVKWLLEHGTPFDPETNEKMKYHGTYIIQ